MTGASKLPFGIAIFGMALGVLIAVIFGINEDLFKDRIAAGIEKNLKIQGIEDPVKKKAVVKSESEKSWRYYQRFHFHSTGIGAMSLALLVCILLLNAPQFMKTIASYIISVGGFFYPFIWLFAGIYGPEMGRSEAKEAFAIFGYMGGVFFIGVLTALFMVMRYDFSRNGKG